MKSATALILILLAAAPALADPPDCLEYAGTMLPLELGALADGNVTSAVAVGPDLLVLGTSSGIDVVDISNLAAPAVLAHIDTEQTQPAAGLARHGSLVYVVGRDVTGILDVSDPAAPAWRAALPDGARAVAVDGDLMALGFYDGTRLYSLADPLEPAILANLAQGGTPVFLSGPRLAVLFSGLVIYDLADPAAPTETHRLEYPTIDGYQYRETTVVHNLTEWGGLLIGRTEHSVRYGDWVYGNVTYNRSYARRTWDLSQGTEPVEVGQDNVDHSQATLVLDRFPVLPLGDVYVDGNQVFQPSAGDLGTVARLPLLAPVAGGLVPRGDGTLLVVAADGLMTVDTDALTVPNAVEVPGQYSIDSGCWRAVASDELLASLTVTSFEFGMMQFSVGCRPGPDADHVSLIETEMPISNLWVAGSDVFYGDSGWFEHVRVTPLGVVDGGLDLASVWDLIDGPGNLVLAMVGMGLQVHDLADATSPQLLSVLSLTGAGLGEYRHLSRQGDLVFVTGSDGTAVVSISQPASPALLATVSLDDGHWTVPGGASVWVRDGQGLLELDLSDPSAPQVQAEAELAILGGPLAVVGNVGYTARGNLIAAVDLDTLQPLGAVAHDVAVRDLDVWAGAHLLLAGNRNSWQSAVPACEVVITGQEDLQGPVTAMQVHPNPFNPRTSVTFSLEQPGAATLRVFDMRGRRVRTMATGALPSGQHRMSWDGRDEGGRVLAAGVYLFQLQHAGGTETARAVLVK